MPTAGPLRPRLTTVVRGGVPEVERARRRGHEALHAAVDLLEPNDPMLPAVLRFIARTGRPRLASPLLGTWRARTIGHRGQERSFPWQLGFDALPGSAIYDTFDGYGALWQPRERDWLEREPTGFGHRLVSPVALAENLEYLAELETDPNAEVARTAAELLRDIQPMVEGEVADFIRGEDPWRDTFALWQLARHPHALRLLHPLVKGLAIRYATLAARLAGLACGTRYPFDGVPLVSASAQLGVGLWMLDYRPTLLPGLVDFVRSSQNADGGWGDEGQPSDVLTTLAAADLLGSLEPSFDPSRAVEFLVRTQEPAGWWRALDPEVPWLTATVLDWLDQAGRPFAERFRWPAHQRTDLDRKTSLPTYAAYDQLVRVFGGLPGLASAPVAVAFADLAKFREFNNAFGQDEGDAVLRFFSAQLRELPAALPIRDGGDEFLIVGAPTRRGLADDLDAFRDRWPARFRARFGADVPPVAPRFLVAWSVGRDLAEIRERLGRAIGEMKTSEGDVGPEGVLQILGT